MNPLARFAPSDAEIRLILEDSLVIMGLVVVAAVIGRGAFRRRAAARHGLWLSTLGLVIFSPALVAILGASGPGRWTVPIQFPGHEPKFTLNQPSQAARPELGEMSAQSPRDVDPPSAADRPAISGPPPLADSEAAPLFRPGVSAPPIIPTPPPRWTRDDWAGLAALVWLAGLIVGLVRLGVGYWSLRSLRRSLQPLDDAAYAAILGHVREVLRVTTLPPVFTAPGVAGPFAAGLIRPYVVLPEGMDRRVVGDVLIHEYAHILRLDLWVGLAQRLAGMIFWPHPAIPYLNRQLGRAREEVCDNFVLQQSDPRGYARTLLTLTESRPPFGLARPSLEIVGARWTLADRVAGLLDPERNRMTRSSLRVRFATFGILVGVGFALGSLRFDRPTALADESLPSAPAASRPIAPEPDLPLGDVRRVVGLVVDEAGKPVVGAIVRPIRRDKAPDGATTAEDGTFTLILRGFRLLSEDLFAEADGGARLGLGKASEPSGTEALAPVRIVLKPSRAVTVRVKDAAGLAVPDASVETIDYSFYAQGQTGADGSATVRLPADGSVRWVIAHKAKVGFDYFENYQTKPAGDLPPLPADVTVTLDGARTVRIKAVDSAGRAVAGVKFDPWYVGKPGKVAQANIGGGLTVSATTDADGVATFDWLPTKVEPGVPFLVHQEDYSCPVSPIYEGAGTTELTARLLKATRISGTVRQVDGQPANRILIQAEGRGETSHYCRMTTRTGADGRYLLDVDPDQKYLIAVVNATLAAQSLTGIAVVEGQPQAGLDLNLISGILLQGQVTRGPDRSPAPGASVSLVQYVALKPEKRNSMSGKEPDQVRFGTTDARGQYQFRIGPGRFRIGFPGPSAQGQELTITDTTEATITRDLHLTEPEPPRMFEGQVVEKRAGEVRPIPNATVEAVSFGRGRIFTARADAQGRFSGARRDAGPLVAYAQTADGRLAGFTTFPAEANDGQATVGPTSMISGRVVDASGKPRAGYRVQIRLDSGTEFATSGQIFRQIRTDEQGRYSLKGVAVDCRGEASISTEDYRRSNWAVVNKFEVLGEDPIEVPDLAFPADSVTKAEPPAIAASTRRLAPTVTSRGEIEALIRSVGRDPVTPELVDRVSLWFLPHNAWAYDLGRTRQLVTDPDFVRRVDAISGTVVGKPADTLTLVNAAAVFHVGRDDAAMTRTLRETIENDRREPVPIEGTIDDSKTGRPLVGAVVHTRTALTRTDDRGRFSLTTRPRPGAGVQYWVEADGYTIREVTLTRAEGPSQAIHLVPEAPFEGQILDLEGRPVVGASLLAWVDRAAVVDHDFDTRNGGANSFILTARSNDQGRFSIPGVPPSKLPVSLEVSHPDHLGMTVSQFAPTSAESPLVIRMTPGARVSGVVVDEQGRAVIGASVELHQPASGRASRSSKSTDAQGRYEFRDVAPGRWNLVVEPEKEAPALVPIVADVARPVENQVVVPPGGYVRGQVVDADGKGVPGASVGWIESVNTTGFGLNKLVQTGADGTFKVGPLPPGEFRLTALAGSPRRLGKVNAKANQTDVTIRLEPDPLPERGR